VKLTLVTRKDCALCIDAARALRELRLDYDVVDVNADPALLALYHEAVPVILDGEREVCRAPITTATLRSALNQVTLN
jgi:glutaredoxin